MTELSPLGNFIIPTRLQFPLVSAMVSTSGVLPAQARCPTRKPYVTSLLFPFTSWISPPRYSLSVSLRVVVMLTLGLTFRPVAVWAAASQIKGITPSCAAVGDPITITGNGFGGQNVTVKVGGVPAQVLSATGNRVTFTVPAEVSGGVTVVTATNPGGQTGGIAFRVKMPEVCGDQTDDDCDGQIDDPDVCVVTNRAPVARAGADHTAPVGTTVQLDGTGSTDPDGDSLSFQWTLSSKPATSAAILSGSTSPTPTFVIDTAGTYAVQLTVSDGRLSSTDTVVISTSNSMPVSNAGPDSSGQVGSTVTLDGSGSSDVDGNPLTYIWTLLSKPATSTAALANPTSVTPSLTIDVFGDYVVQLVVTDGLTSSPPDTVTISTLNTKPAANAGADQSAQVTETVTLNGSGSNDVDGNALTYTWSLTSKPSGSTVGLTNPTTPMPSLTLDKAGTYGAQLLVNDGIASSDPDTVTISTVNTKPVAHAGADQSATVGTVISLNGAGSSDVDGDPLTYSWSLTSKPANSTATIQNPTTVIPQFTLDVAGPYVVQLIVHDGTVNSEPATVTISTVNSKPIANPGLDQHGVVGATITLNGSGSSDVDGDALTYQWSVTTKPATSTATLQDETSVTPSFVLDKAGTYTVQLIVHDGTVASDPATVTITTLNSKPVANAGADHAVLTGHTVQLDGSGSQDVDDDAFSYFWSVTVAPTGSTASISNTALVTPTFVPDLAGTYVLQLIVHDGTVESDPDTMTLSVTTLDTFPPAPADLDKITISPVTAGQVTVSGSAGSVEAGATVTITNPRTGAIVTVTANADGSFTAPLAAQAGDQLSLVVTDAAGNSSTLRTVRVAPTAATAAKAGGPERLPSRTAPWPRRRRVFRCSWRR